MARRGKAAARPDIIMAGRGEGLKRRAFAKLQTPAITPSAARPRKRTRGTSLKEGGKEEMPCSDAGGKGKALCGDEKARG